MDKLRNLRPQDLNELAASSEPLQGLWELSDSGHDAQVALAKKNLIRAQMLERQKSELERLRMDSAAAIAEEKKLEATWLSAQKTMTEATVPWSRLGLSDGLSLRIKADDAKSAGIECQLTIESDIAQFCREFRECRRDRHICDAVKGSLFS